MSEKYALVDAECAALAGDEACAPSVAQACEWPDPGAPGHAAVAAGVTDPAPGELFSR